MTQTQIETEGRPIVSVLQELEDALVARDEEFQGEGPFYNLSLILHPRTIVLWPEYRWLAVYVVRGGSEGWYVHIDALSKLEISEKQGHYTKAIQIASKKVMVRAYAYAIAQATAELLDA